MKRILVAVFLTVWLTIAVDLSTGADAQKGHNMVKRGGPRRGLRSFLFGTDDVESVPMKAIPSSKEEASSPSHTPPPALPGPEDGDGEGARQGQRPSLELKKGCFWGSGGFTVRVRVRNGNVTVVTNQRRRG